VLKYKTSKTSFGINLSKHKYVGNTFTLNWVSPTNDYRKLVICRKHQTSNAMISEIA
jgi:hypothetical protein